MNGSHVVIVSNQIPRPHGGGPHGVIRLIANHLASQEQRSNADEELTLMAESTVVDPRDVEQLSLQHGMSPEIGIKARLDRILAQYRVLGDLRRRWGRLLILQFEVPKAALLLRILHPTSVRLIVSEHSKGGLDVEARAARSRWLTILKIRFAVSLSFRVADAIVWPSYGAITEYHENHAPRRALVRKYAVVHNGVEHGHSSADRVSERSARLLVVAADVPDKNVSGLFLMLERVARGLDRDLQIDWFGGPFVGRISRFENVVIECHGVVPRDEVQRAMDKALCLVAFPLRTIFDLVILEAMMSSTPVLCPPMEGYVEALGENYPLYFRDDAELERCLKMIDDMEEHAKIGAQLRERARAIFTVERMIAGYIGAGRVQ